MEVDKSSSLAMSRYDSVERTVKWQDLLENHKDEIDALLAEKEKRIRKKYKRKVRNYKNKLIAEMQAKGVPKEE